MVLLLLTTIPAAVSAWWAINAAANVWKFGRKSLPVSFPDRTPFHARDAIDFHDDFEHFKKKYLAMSEAEFTDAALADIWSAMLEHCGRYRNLQRALRFTIGAFVLFALGAIFTISGVAQVVNACRVS